MDHLDCVNMPAAPIHVVNVSPLDRQGKFDDPFRLEITFDCISPGVKDDLEWKLIYVGSPEDEKYDQILESIVVGPVSLGRSKFIFETDPPVLAKIPHADLFEVTVILLTCSYREKEFIRIGYFVKNDYEGIENVEDYPSEKEIVISKISRTILQDHPRVTRFDIAWDEPEGKNPDMEQFIAENNNLMKQDNLELENDDALVNDDMEDENEEEEEEEEEENSGPEEGSESEAEEEDEDSKMEL